MNGDDAIAKIELHKPDVVLLDYNLPGQSGTSILTKSMDDDFISSIPIVMMTTRRSEWSAKIATDLGAKGYLKKPFSSIELLAAIESYV